MKKVILAGLLAVFLIGIISVSAQDKTTLEIPAGDNQFKVVDAGFNVQLPDDFFGPGSEPFEGMIICRGEGDGSADTTIKRLDNIILPPPPSEDTIPIEIIELNLVSCQPITVNNNNGSQQQWSINVGLSPNAPLVGQMTIKRAHENGGTFDSHLPVQPRFTFTQVGGSSEEDVKFIDDPVTPAPIGIVIIEDIVIDAFEAFDVPWFVCTATELSPEPTFCPDSILFSAEDSWLNLEPVIPDGGSPICPDADDDSACDAIDNCHLIANPDQSDLDTDGLGDACDNCPFDPDNDADDDGICGDVDSCPNENPQGLDADSDGCTDTIEGLYDNLQDTKIHPGVKNSLLAKVNRASSSLTRGRVNAAINQLEAFINQIKAQFRKKISQKDADVLAGFAQNIIWAAVCAEQQEVCDGVDNNCDGAIDEGCDRTTLDKKHASEKGPDYTKYVPKSYIHASEKGPRKSEYVPGHFKHASEKGPDYTKYFSDDWVHNSEKGPDKSKYSSEYYIHADKGPEESKYFPKGWVHASEKGPDYTKYYSTDWRHIPEGPDESRYFSKDWVHASEKGPSESKYFPKDWVHASEKGPDKSSYVPGDYKHASEEGVQKSEYVPGNWKHMTQEGPYKSIYGDWIL